MTIQTRLFSDSDIHLDAVHVADVQPITNLSIDDSIISTKICPRCSIKKARADFYPSSTRPDKIRSECKTCTQKDALKWQDDNPDKKQKASRKFSYKKINFTEKEYDVMLAAQNSKCAICDSEFAGLTRSGNNARLSVDHEHDTGIVRGLLCKRCNMGLGYFGDSPELLNKAIAYLNKSKVD